MFDGLIDIYEILINYVFRNIVYVYNISRCIIFIFVNVCILIYFIYGNRILFMKLTSSTTLRYAINMSFMDKYFLCFCALGKYNTGWL